MDKFQDFIGIDFWTALFVLLNTLAVFFVAKKFLFVPVKKMIDDRQKEIDDMYAEANSAKTEAAALEAEYQQKLSKATETGERIVKEAVIRGQNREEEIIRQANAEAAAMYYHDTIIPGMHALRTEADALEAMTDKSYWPYPTYSDLLFY